MTDQYYMHHISVQTITQLQIQQSGLCTIILTVVVGIKTLNIFIILSILQFQFLFYYQLGQLHFQYIKDRTQYCKSYQSPSLFLFFFSVIFPRLIFKVLTSHKIAENLSRTSAVSEIFHYLQKKHLTTLYYRIYKLVIALTINADFKDLVTKVIHISSIFLQF